MQIRIKCRIGRERIKEKLAKRTEAKRKKTMNGREKERQRENQLERGGGKYEEKLTP